MKAMRVTSAPPVLFVCGVGELCAYGSPYGLPCLVIGRVCDSGVPVELTVWLRVLCDGSGEVVADLLDG